MRWMVVLLAASSVGGCAQVRGTRLRADAPLGDVSRKSGLYLTPGDFETGQLSNVIMCQSASRPIAREAFSRSSDVVWPREAESARYAKSELFGFRACDGTEVRFFKAANYRVIRAPPLYLYEHEHRESMGKSGSRLVLDHGFSTTAADSVRPLTLDALKRAYPTEHRFHDVLDLAFHNDEELVRYDDFHHEYRVARLLRQSREALP